MKSIYLDYNSTTPLFASAKKAMIEAMDYVGNASSVHHMGQKVNGLIEKSRRTMADCVKVNPEQIIFTSCATESINMIMRAEKWDKVILSNIEHAAVKESAEVSGAELHFVKSDQQANLDLQDLEVQLKLAHEKDQKTLVALMCVSNILGTIFPAAEIAALCLKYGTTYLCDTVQAIGRIPVDLNEIGADYYPVSAHKFGGPKGIGALIIKEGTHPKPFMVGGGQEKNYRAGTENVIGIAGMAVALNEAIARLDEFAKLANLRDRMEAKIKGACPEAVILAEKSNRAPNTCSIVMPGVPSEKQLIAFDLKGICLSTGSACSSGKVKANNFLEDMGYPSDYKAQILRISMGWDTTEAEVDAMADAWIALSAS